MKFSYEICASLIAAALLAGSDVSAQEKSAGGVTRTQLSFGTVSKTIFMLPVWVAQDQGYFRDLGLEVDIKVTKTLDLKQEMLDDGRLHVVIGAPDSVIAERAEGKSDVIVAGNAKRLPHQIIASSKIRSLGDLKGARIGVAGATDGTTALLPQIAAKAGFDPALLDVRVVGGAPTRWKLLQSGEIDAGLQPFPQSYEAEAAGFNNLGAMTEIIPDYLFTGLVAKEEWAKQNRETLVKLLRAMRRGSAAISSNREMAAQIAAREMDTSQEASLRAVNDLVSLDIMSWDLSVPEPALRRVFETVQANGGIAAETAFKASDYVDASYLEEARID